MPTETNKPNKATPVTDNPPADNLKATTETSTAKAKRQVQVDTETVVYRHANRDDVQTVLAAETRRREILEDLGWTVATKEEAEEAERALEEAEASDDQDGGLVNLALAEREDETAQQTDPALRLLPEQIANGSEGGRSAKARRSLSAPDSDSDG